MHYYIRQWDEIGVIGSFTLHVADLLFAFTMIYCSVWALGRWRYSPLEYLNLLLSAILILNFARGMVAVGSAPAGVHFRSLYVGYVSAALFVFLMHRRIDSHWVLDKVVLLGWGIVALSVARLAFGLNAFLDPAFLAINTEAFGLNRTLNSDGALMLGEATLIVVSRLGALPPGPKRSRMTATFVTFVSALLISNQRSATVATLAGMGAVLAAWPQRRRSVVLAAGSFVLITAGAAVYGTWIAARGDIMSLFPRAIDMLGSDWTLDNETYVWRTIQWQSYIDFYGHETLWDQIMGLPLGAILALRSNLDEMLQVSPHSGYIALLMDAGIVGVVLFVSMLIVGVTKGIMLLRRGPSGGTFRSDVGLAIAILISLAVFSYTYVVSNEHGLLLAIALQIIATAPGFAGRPALSRQGPVRRRMQRLGSGIAGAPVSLRTAPLGSRATE